MLKFKEKVGMHICPESKGEKLSDVLAARRRAAAKKDGRPNVYAAQKTQNKQNSNNKTNQ